MNAHHRKTRQLCAAIERTLAQSLACDVEDPALDDVMLDRVEAVDGAFVAVFTSPMISLDALADLQSRLDASAPLFREAMARELTRKRVPTVLSVLVPHVDAQRDRRDRQDDEHRSFDELSDR